MKALESNPAYGIDFLTVLANLELWLTLLKLVNGATEIQSYR